MKKILFIFSLIVISSMVFSAISQEDIINIEAKYKENCLQILQNFPIPDYYYSKNPDGSYYIYDSQPELSLGMHVIDEIGADQMNRADIKFVRITLYWSAMVNDKESYLSTWHKYETLFEDFNIIPVVVVHGNPEKYNYDNRQEAYKDFAEFMAWLVGELKSVRYWQLWNEMDYQFTDIFGAKKISYEEIGKNYVEMLKLTYPKIKEANPDAIVLLGPPIFPEFIENVYKAGGKDYFDIATMHSYSTPTKWEFIRKGLMARTYMNKYGDVNKPLWNTEFGTEAGKYYNTYGKVPDVDPLGVFDRMQRDEIAECVNINNVLGLYSNAFIYQYIGEPEARKKEISERVEFPEGDSIENYGFSIVREDRSPRPAFQWILDNKPNKKNKTLRKVKVKIGEFTKEVEVHPGYPTKISLK